MSKICKCPYLGKLVSSYRFYGFYCHIQFKNGWRHGDILKWTKEERTNKMKEYGCYNNGEECPWRKELNK
jgi:hypothetical protein